jgi:alpha-glucosidase
MVKIHVLMKPYLKHLSIEYQNLGIPPIRGCFLHYENDPELYNLKYQYLFGQDLLIAPVIKPNQKEWKVYFPDDFWVHIWSGKRYKKGWNLVNAPLGEPPVFYKFGSSFTDLFEKIKSM